MAEATAVALDEDDYAGATGGASAAVDSLLATLAFDAGDPRSVMGVIARRLAAAFDRSPSAAIARELRATVAWVAERPTEHADQLDEIRARRLVRLVDVATARVVGGDE